MDLSALIDVRPGVRGGKHCFIGSRIAVCDVLEFLASGMTHDEIISDFPELDTATDRVVWAYAGKQG